MQTIEVGRTALSAMRDALASQGAAEGAKDLSVVIDRLLEGTVAEVVIVAPLAPSVPKAPKPQKVRRRTGRKPATLMDAAGELAPGTPALPHILESLDAFPEETRSCLVRCLGLGQEPEHPRHVAAHMGTTPSVVTGRLDRALSSARTNFQWARIVAEQAVAQVGSARVATSEIAESPWAKGLGARAVEIMVPRLTRGLLRLRRAKGQVVLVRRDRLRFDP